MSEVARKGKHQTEWITISVDEYESMRRTIDVLSDKDLMGQIKEGKKKETNMIDFEDLAAELEI